MTTDDVFSSIEMSIGPRPSDFNPIEISIGIDDRFLSILCYRNFDSILPGVICLSLLKGSSLLEVSTP